MELGLHGKVKMWSSEATSRQKPQTQHLLNLDSRLQAAVLRIYMDNLYDRCFSKWGAWIST